MAKLAFLVAWVAWLPVVAWAQLGGATSDGLPNSGVQASVQEGRGIVSAAPTAAEAEAAFQAARESYRAVAEGAPLQQPADIEQSVTPTTIFVAGGRPQNIELEAIKLVLDVENAPLRQIVADVVAQAAQYTGPWRVKWRLKPENMGLLDEQVNLTAEAPFGAFFGLLAERVKNLTGTQLFVTVFAGARVILVTDTYY